MITELIISTTAITIEDKNLFSNLRCMKILNTNVDLTAAMISAIATVSVPSEIRVRVTEVNVKVINNARTYRKVRYGIM
jgi:hypothetical protein